MTPVNVLPVWVICHVMFAIIEADMPHPIIVLLESDADPAQVPATVVPEVPPFVVVGVLGEVGLASVGDPPPQAVTARIPTRTTANSKRIFMLLLREGYSIDRCPDRPARHARVAPSLLKRPLGALSETMPSSVFNEFQGNVGLWRWSSESPEA